MTSSSLKQYLRRFKKMEETTKPHVWKRWCLQILSALAYLHENKIVHGNIRCEGMFLQHTGLLKLGITYRFISRERKRERREGGRKIQSDKERESMCVCVCVRVCVLNIT